MSKSRVPVRTAMVAMGVVLWSSLATAGGQHGDAAQSAGASPQVDELVVRMLLPRARGTQVFTIRFTAPAEATGEGRWFHGTGSATAADGDVVCPTMNVKLLVSIRSRPSTIIEREEGALAYFSDSKLPVDVIHYAPSTTNGKRFAVVVSHVQQNAATVVLEGAWDRVGGVSTMSGVLAELYRILTLESAPEPDSNTSCAVTLDQCFQTAQLACGDAGIQSFGYSCDPQTGEAKCEFTCYAQGGGS